MKGPLLILLVAVFLLVVLAWLVRATDPQKRLGSKAYHMLLLGWMKLDIALAHGRHYMRRQMLRNFSSYHENGLDTERIHKKEQRLREFRKENGESAAYKKKEHYNRKILE